jgi:glycosyltransferase 2 family protein
MSAGTDHSQDRGIAAAAEMRKLSQLPRFAPLALTILFAAWCVNALHGELSQLSIAPLLRSWDVVAAAALLSLLNYLLRILRWRSYLAKLGYSFTLRFSAASYVAGFAYTLSPGKVGEMVRARYYVPRGVPLASVTAAFFAERLLDIIAMLVLASLLATAVTRFASFIVFAVLMVVVVLASIAFVPWTTVKAKLYSLHRTPAWLRKTLLGLVSTLVSTRPLLKPAMLVGGFVAGLLAWGFEGAGLGLLTSIYPSVNLTLTSALGIYGIAVLVGGLSFLPGGLGSTEVIMVGLLSSRGYPLSEALMLTLVCRLVTLWLAVCLGWIAVFSLRQATAPAVEV